MSSPTPQAEPVKTVEPFELDKRISSVVSGTERADLLSHTPGESTPVYVRVPLAGAIVYAHLALAWQHGFSFERVLGSIPKPWSTLLKLLGLSFTLYVAKAPLLEHVCSRLLGFTRQQTWNMRWTADNYHLLSTLVGVWAVVFGTEADGPLEIETVGVYVISIIAYLALAAYTNICQPVPHLLRRASLPTD